MFYPEPAFIGAVVSLALLLPLPPLDQAGGMVSGQTDVTAAGRGTDSAPDASGEEGLRAEWQLHPARKRHKERAVGADSVWTLSVVLWVGHTCTEERRKPQIHTRMQNAASEKKGEKHQLLSGKTSVTVWWKLSWEESERYRSRRRECNEYKSGFLWRCFVGINC